MLIQLTEQAQNPDGSFVAVVAFADVAEYKVTVRDPADASAERMLAWYFEEHLRFPFLDRDLERRAVAQLADYGRSLFGQVFGGGSGT